MGVPIFYQGSKYKPLPLVTIPSDDPIGDALRADLVAYWTMNESSGTRSDSVNSHNAVPSGPIASAEGMIGNAIHFDRSQGNYLTVPDHIDLRRTGNIYIFGWTRNLSLPDLVNSFGSTLIVKDDPNTGVYEYEVYYGRAEGPNDFIAFYVANLNGDLSVNVSINDTPLDWHFFEAYYRASDTEIGIALDHGSFSTSLSFFQVDLTTSDVILGTDPGTGSFYNADSLLDEMGFMKPSSVPISQEQRDYLWNSGAGRTLYP